MPQAISSPDLGLVAFLAYSESQVLGLVCFIDGGVVDEDGVSVDGGGGELPIVPRVIRGSKVICRSKVIRGSKVIRRSKVIRCRHLATQLWVVVWSGNGQDVREWIMVRVNEVRKGVGQQVEVGQWLRFELLCEFTNITGSGDRDGGVHCYASEGDWGDAFYSGFPFAFIVFCDQLWCMHLCHWFPRIVCCTVPFPLYSIL